MSNKISNYTNKSYKLSLLYANHAKNNFIADNNTVSIIGTIEIPKINITYPILSKCTDELLKISVCRFYGPLPNKTGNLCIAGHNYDNEDFFSKLYLLKVNDIVNIYTLNNHKISYYIYELYEIEPQNVDSLSQATNRKKRDNINHL